MAKTVSLIIALEGLAMVPSIICAAVFGETRVLITFAVVSVFCVATGAWMYSHMRKYVIRIKTREGYFVVLLCWATVILVGFMPYYFSGAKELKAFVKELYTLTDADELYKKVENCPFLV